MDKNTNAKLMNIAERILNAERSTCPLFKSKDGDDTIYKSYNGQIASLGVSILTIGLKPTISVFYQDAPQKNETIKDAYRRFLLDVIAKMLSQYRTEQYHFQDAMELCRAVINDADDNMKTDIINCSIALKEVIRTYNLG